MNLWLIASCFLVVLTLLLLKKKKKNSKKSMKLPPGPSGLPIIGNLHQLGSFPHLSFINFSKTYGPIFSLKLGSVPTVVVTSAETVRDVLKTFDVNCCTRPLLTGANRLTYNSSDVVFSSYDGHWKDLRKICTNELLSTKRVQSFQYIRREEVDLFLESVKKSALTQTPFNLGKKFLTLSGSYVCRVAFGMGIQGSEFDNDVYEDLIAEAAKIVGGFAAADFLPYVGWIVDRITGLHAQREKVFHALDDFYDHVIDNHVNNKRQHDGEDIVDVLLKIEKDQAGIKEGFKFSRNHMKGIFMNIFVAGQDPTALILEWIMSALIAHPRVMKKAQAEVRDVIKDKENITEEDIDRLPYLHMVIKESLRLHTPGALLAPRETMADIKINGYDIPAKTRIEVCIWAITHDPNLWKDPEEFIPERFMDKNIDYKGQDFELLPFGSGRRICPGMNLAMSLLYMTLINVLYRYDWRLPEGMTEKDVSFEGKFGIVISKKIPLELVPVMTQWT